MSYDIFAFDRGTLGADGLLGWFKEQAEWSEPHSYNDPAVATPKLQAFYCDLIKVFPAMDGPDVPGDNDDADTSYCIGATILYVGFRWARADHAREVFVRLGMTHGVGVCEVSESPAVVHSPPGDATVAPATRSSASVASVETDAQSRPMVVVGEADNVAKTVSGGTGHKGEGRLYL